MVLKAADLALSSSTNTYIQLSHPIDTLSSDHPPNHILKPILCLALHNTKPHVVIMCAAWWIAWQWYYQWDYRPLYVHCSYATCREKSSWKFWWKLCSSGIGYTVAIQLLFQHLITLQHSLSTCCTNPLNTLNSFPQLAFGQRYILCSCTGLFR